MKPLSKLLWGLLTAAALVRCAPAQIVTTDTYVEFAQRGPGGTVETRGARGDQNLWKVWGFDINGHLAPLSIAELITGSGYTITPADGSVTSAKIVDGTIVAGDLADGAATEAKIGSGAVTSAKIADGTISNDDVAANASIAVTKLAQRVGTDWAATTAAPITANPYSPTWTTETYVVPYGTNGTVNFPPIATYTKAVLIILTTGSNTVTMNPNGTEQIVVSGSGLGAGVDDTITGTPGLMTAYVADGGRWVRVMNGGSGGFPNPAVEDLNMGGRNIVNAANITATTFTGSAANQTNIQAAEVEGTFPDDVGYGKITTAKGHVFTPNPIAATTGSSITVATGSAENVITLNEAAETVLFDVQPEVGKSFIVRMIVDLPDPVTVCDVTWPSTWSFAAGTLRTLLKVPDNKPQSITVWWTGTEYQMDGDPYEIAELPEDTTPAITAAIPIDQGAGTERTSLAKIRELFEPDWIGSFATPSTAATISGAFDAMSLYVVTGGNQEIDLEDATGYGGRGIVFYFDGTSTMTVDPAAGDVIYINGTAMAADEKLIISGTAGQVGIIASDDANWSTSGGSATYTQETP